MPKIKKPSKSTIQAPESHLSKARQEVTATNFDEIALGELPATAVLTALRAMLADPDAKSHARAYQMLRALAWKKFAERIVGDEMREWHDLFRQVAGLFELAEAPGLSQKAAAFADLAIESIRFGHANDIGEMQRRTHVREILQIISKHGGIALRSVVMADTGLKQANLSRVLAHMAAAGFVERRPSGREVLVSLTSLGREVIASPTRHGPSSLTVFPPLDEIRAATTPTLIS